MILHLEGWCRDAFNATVVTDGKHTVVVDNDYVPLDLGIGGGDALRLSIDVSTGKILNWDSDSVKERLKEMVESQTEIDDEIDTVWASKQ